MKQKDMDKILEIGVLLSSERDLSRLLDQILTSVMELTRCDGGTLYLLDEDCLRFKIMRNNTLGTSEGGDGRDPGLPPVPLDRKHVCALSLIEDRVIRVEDVRKCREYDFSGPIEYDAIFRYHTQSMFPCATEKGRRSEFCR